MSRSKPSWLATEIGSCYSLHFVPRYRHAAHYQGWAKEGGLAHRLVDHLMGRGANLTKVQLNAGGGWVVTNVEHGVTRDRETQRKETSAVKQCKVCKAERDFTAGKSDAAEALQAAGWDGANPHERQLLLDDFGLAEPPEPLRTPEPGPDVIQVRHPRAEPSGITPEQLAEMDRLADDLCAKWRTELEQDPKAENEMEMG